MSIPFSGAAVECGIAGVVYLSRCQILLLVPCLIDWLQRCRGCKLRHRLVNVLEVRDHIPAEQLDRVHNRRVRHLPNLAQQQQLVHPRVRILLHRLDTVIRVSADHRPVLDSRFEVERTLGVPLLDAFEERVVYLDLADKSPA
jgi:hypothetical protein